MGSLERVFCSLPGVVTSPILCSLGDEAIAGEGVLERLPALFFWFPTLWETYGFDPLYFVFFLGWDRTVPARCNGFWPIVLINPMWK